MILVIIFLLVIMCFNIVMIYYLIDSNISLKEKIKNLEQINYYLKNINKDLNNENIIIKSIINQKKLK